MPENSLNTANKFTKFRKDFAELLGDTRRALVLQEVLYQLQHSEDYHAYLEEEMDIDDYDNENLQMLSEGWILLTAGFLKEAMSLPCSKRTIARSMCSLTERGYLVSKEADYGDAPKNSKMYRLNLQKLASDLNDIGYYFEVPEP